MSENEVFTPYFNDGEACVFGVHDFTFRLATATGDEGDYEDGFCYAWDWEGAKRESLKDFARAVTDKDVMLSVFGDHVTITATRDGFDVDEYSHD